MLKKILFLFFVIVTFGIKNDVKALDMSAFQYKEYVYVYDLVNAYTNEEEQELIKIIKKFVKLSNVDVVLVVDEGESSFDSIFNILYSNSTNFGKGMKKNGILIYYDEKNSMTYFSIMVDDYYDSPNLIEFRRNYIDKYNRIVSDISNIKFIINEWNEYYYLRNLKFLVIIGIVSLIITKIILDEHMKIYTIVNNKNANYYYDASKVEFKKKIKKK